MSGQVIAGGTTSEMNTFHPAGSGNEETAEVLALIEEGVPLHWCRHVHEYFPDSFRQKVRWKGQWRLCRQTIFKDCQPAQ
jgi:hypothetical protein